MKSSLNEPSHPAQGGITIRLSWMFQAENIPGRPNRIFASRPGKFSKIIPRRIGRRNNGDTVNNIVEPRHSFVATDVVAGGAFFFLVAFIAT
jgi:hypothetical protein